MPRAFSSLIKKDLLLTIRSSEIWVIMFSFIGLLALNLAIGLQGLFLTRSVLSSLLPSLVLLLFLLTGLFTAERATEAEYQDDARSRLILLKIPMHLQFFSKLIIYSFILTVCFIISLCALILLLGVGAQIISYTYIAASLLTIFGYSTLITLLVGFAASSSLRSLILPILTIPLSAPLTLCYLALCNDAGSMIAWNIIILCDLVYLFLGVVLYKYV